MPRSKEEIEYLQTLFKTHGAFRSTEELVKMPKSCILTLEDVREIRRGETIEIECLAPITAYTHVEILNINNYWVSTDKPGSSDDTSRVGLFYDLLEGSVWGTGMALTGSGAFPWLKCSNALLNHLKEREAEMYGSE